MEQAPRFLPRPSDVLEADGDGAFQSIRPHAHAPSDDDHVGTVWPAPRVSLSTVPRVSQDPRTPRWWPTEGEEPDPRWSLANERTLLAYERTSVGLVVAGLAVAGSRSIADAPAWLAAIGLPLIALGGAVALLGRRRFINAQRAMRTGAPLPAPRVAALLPLGVAAVALGGLVLAAVQLLTE